MTPRPPYKVFIGFDVHQMCASAVAEHSVRMKTCAPVDVRRLALSELVARGLYTRPTVFPQEGSPRYWDEISQAPMSTAHAIARFLVPTLCEFAGWAVFTDGDVIFRSDIRDLFRLADPQYAVQVVQHDHSPIETSKMEGQAQTRYPRKNWSSVVLWNCGHQANRALTVDLVNTVPGRDLHRFCWLDDAEVGALPTEWNVLIGEQSHPNPAVAHFTLGVPDMPGYEHQPFADEWYATAKACGYRLQRPEKAEAVA